MVLRWLLKETRLFIWDWPYSLRQCRNLKICLLNIYNYVRYVQQKVCSTVNMQTQTLALSYNSCTWFLCLILLLFKIITETTKLDVCTAAFKIQGSSSRILMRVDTKISGHCCKYRDILLEEVWNFRSFTILSSLQSGEFVCTKTQGTQS